MIAGPIVVIARIVFWVHDLKIGTGTNAQAQPFAAGFYDLRATDEDRGFGGFFQNALGGAQHALILALGKDDTPCCGLCSLKYGFHQQSGFEHGLI